MVLDSDIATAIKTALASAELSVIVQTSLSSRITKVPFVGVNTDGTGPNGIEDLTGTFYRKEEPFIIEIIGSSAANTDAILDCVEKAIVGMTFSSGWMEFSSQTKFEVTKKYQKYKQGKKIYYEDLSV